MRQDKYIVSPTLANKKRVNSESNNVTHTHFFASKMTVLESGLLCMVVQVVYCTTLRDTTNITLLVPLALGSLQPAEPYADALAGIYGPVSRFPGGKDNSNGSVYNTLGFTLDTI